MVQGYVGGERSAWADVRRLPPGSTLAWSPGGPPRIQRYWDLPTGPLLEVGDLDALHDELREWLEAHCPQEMRKPLDPGLEGGYWGGRKRHLADPVARLWCERCAERGCDPGCGGTIRGRDTSRGDALSA